MFSITSSTASVQRAPLSPIKAVARRAEAGDAPERRHDGGAHLAFGDQAIDGQVLFFARCLGDEARGVGLAFAAFKNGALAAIICTAPNSPA